MVGVSRGVYPVCLLFGMLLVSSTAVKAMYLLVYVDPWNVHVGTLAGESVVEEWIVFSPVNVPNRLSATIMPQRLAAQYGQYSAPSK